MTGEAVAAAAGTGGGPIEVDVVKKIDCYDVTAAAADDDVDDYAAVVAEEVFRLVRVIDGHLIDVFVGFDKVHTQLPQRCRRWVSKMRWYPGLHRPDVCR